MWFSELVATDKLVTVKPRSSEALDRYWAELPVQVRYVLLG